MVEKYKFFLLFLLFNHIVFSHQQLEAEEKSPIKIEIGTSVLYDISRNYFQFDYNGSNYESIYFFFNREFYVKINITDPYGNSYRLYEDYYQHYSRYEVYQAYLKLNGTYFLKIECDVIDCIIGSNFTSIIPGKDIDIIDFSKNVYFNKIDFGTDTIHPFKTYKVKNIKKSQYVYFSMLRELNNYYHYYPYYPDEPDPYYDGYYNFNNLTIFEVCDDGTNKCKKNVRLYYFNESSEYTIIIHYLKNYYKYHDNYEKEYYHTQYLFFPFKEETIKEINSDTSGSLILDNPSFFTINNETEKNKSILVSELENELVKMFFAEINDTNNITELYDLKFEQASKFRFVPNITSSIIFFVFSSDFESKAKFFVVDEVENINSRETCVVPAKTSKIIYNDERKYSHEYYISTFHSDKKNMKFDFSYENETTDLIIQNYYPFHIFVEKGNTDSTIHLKKYLLKYTIFGAVDPYYYKSFYQFGNKYLKSAIGIDIDSYLRLSQANFRIKSKYLPFFEFYNLYISGIDVKLKVYIRQLYGGTDLYECDPDGVNLNNLEKLTTPISGSKCKNKKSLINRLFDFNNEKIISGYISHDSYFDVYAEIDKDTDTIDINPVLTSKLNVNSTAKYLKKNIEYKLNFHASHKVKLEPGFDAHITIKNALTSFSINPDNPTVEISGDDFTIKSDNDALVYFFGKLPNLIAKQIKIDNIEGKYVKISNINDAFIFDFGFKGYLPSTYPLDFRYRNNTFYLDNLYAKLKRKLVKNEYLYIYRFANDENENITIEYIDNNLNIRNSDFNIFYIPENTNVNQKESTLIINTFELKDIKNNFYFCRQNNWIEFSLDNYNNRRTITNDNSFDLRLGTGSNKISFKTNQPFIYSYSFYDVIDEDIFARNENWLNEREVMYDLDILEVKDENNADNKINIKFKTNYKKSTTRYIFVVARKSGNNTLANFKDPCYVTKLLNQRPEGVKVDKIYDIGDKDSINAIVDISSITDLNKNQGFFVSIISQEMRYEKKINFYNPYEFEHKGKEKSSDYEEEEGGAYINPDDPEPSKDDEPPVTGSKDDDNGDLKGSSLALAVVTPILCVIIIILIVLLFLSHKRISSHNTKDEIEKLV